MIECSLRHYLHFPAGSSDLQVEFSLNRESTLAIYGPSGSGKTSVLRMICGFMPVAEGKITMDNKTLLDTSRSIKVSPNRRGIGMVFQDYALFPQMTVLQNLRYAQAQKDEDLIEHVTDIMELQSFVDRRPNLLSGGQQQRVALARAIVQKPNLLLLDEPLAALDRTMRSKLQGYLLKVRTEFEFPIILVSHDVGEIVRLCDQVIHLVDGRVVSQGSPLEVFRSANHPSHLRLTGRLIATRQESKEAILSLLMGSQIYEMAIDQAQANDLKIGQMIDLSTAVSNLKIKPSALPDTP